jgi:hypothetical protein
MTGATSPLPSLWHDVKLSKRYIFMAWCLVNSRDNFTFAYRGEYLELRGRKWRKLHDVEHHNLYASPNIARVIKSRGWDMQDM